MYVYSRILPNLSLDKKEFGAIISEISPIFCDIYNQAYAAQQMNLSQICGVGYRKALEFLIKDYIMSGIEDDKKDGIKQKNLAKCIKEDISSPNVKAVAARATWIGNDETHYVRKWEDKDIKDLIMVLGYGILGVTFSQFTYFFTIQYSSAGVGTIMQDLSPVIILKITSAMEKRRPRIKEVSAVVLAIVGVFLIVTHGDIANFKVPPIAIVSGLTCAFCVSVYNILTAPLTKHRDYPVLVLQTWSFVLGGILTGLVFHPWTYHYVPTAMGYVGIATVVIVGNMLAFSLYISGVSEIGPNLGILYSFAEPLSAAVLSTALHL
jgi:drug/metabolite transporter (DMT)-like permease